jgi:uncharacterized membrane protein
MLTNSASSPHVGKLHRLTLIVSIPINLYDIYRSTCPKPDDTQVYQRKTADNPRNLHHRRRGDAFCCVRFIRQNRAGLSALPVYVSGFFEILGGIGILVPPVSQAAAWGLLILFIAVFPANINMAVNAIDLPHIPDSSLLRWGRLPLQAVLIAWAWWYTRSTDLQQQASLLPRQLVADLTQDLGNPARPQL